MMMVNWEGLLKGIVCSFLGVSLYLAISPILLDMLAVSGLYGYEYAIVSFGIVSIILVSLWYLVKMAKEG